MKPPSTISWPHVVAWRTSRRRRARSSRPSRTRWRSSGTATTSRSGGCLFSRTPMALVREILRQRRRGLTLSRNLMCTEGEFLMVTGGVERVVTAWMSIGLPWGVSRILRHYVESGAGGARGMEPPRPRVALPCGSHGHPLPARPDHARLGSDGGRRDEDDRGSVYGTEPGGGARPLPRRGHPARAPGRPIRQRADRRLSAHGRRHRAGGHHGADDHRGDHPGGGDAALSRTARSSRASSSTPSCTCRSGRFPHECYALYEADYDHFGEYTAAIDARGPAAVVDYLDRYVFRPPTFADYLDLFGGARLAAQQKKARELTR